MKTLILRYVKFALSTLAGTGVDTLVLYIFAHWVFKDSYIGKTIIAPMISFECAVFTNYAQAYFFVFNDRIENATWRDFRRRLYGYNLSCVAGFLVKMVLLVGIQLAFHFDVVWCNLIALCFSGLLNFMLNNHLIFRNKNKKANQLD